MSKGPVLFDLESNPPPRGGTAAELTPATAPPVPDPEHGPPAAAMQRAAHLAARSGGRRSRLGLWFWGLLGALLGFFASVAAWDAVTGLLARAPVLGAIATTLIALFALVLLMIAAKELAAFGRLRRVDRIQSAAAEALADANLTRARSVCAQIEALYRDREDTAWGRATLRERQAEVFDADGLLGLVETAVLAPLDKRAGAQVEAAARQVATVTAIVPLALADVFTALTANMRMIRRIAEIYGGRAGVLGSWRLTRQVLAHLVATGAVAVGDDLIGSVAGGGVLSKVSRRFGEGVINGALTARVGVAAMEVCRPLPFVAQRKPSVTHLVKRALTGLFSGRSGGKG